MTISTHRRPLDPGDAEPVEADLLDLVRAHDTEAFRLLYERHRLAVLNCARQYSRTTFDAEDLTEEAFARVLKLLHAGAGPQTAFRAYLCTVVRHLAADRGRRSAREETVDDLPEPRDQEHGDAMAATVERGYVQRAFETLPNRWRQVLWLGEVEGRKPAEIATLLGMSPRSVSALAYRAREGLSQAYLQAHLGPQVPAGCRRTLERLPAYVRSGLPDASTEQVRQHLAVCAFCRTRLVELTELDRDLRGLLAPVLIGATATGGTAGVSGTAGQWLGRLKDTVGQHFADVVASGVATTVIAATAVVGLVQSSPDAAQSAAPPPRAAPPAPMTAPKRPAPAAKKPPAAAKPRKAPVAAKPRKAPVAAKQPVRSNRPPRSAPAVPVPQPAAAQPVANHRRVKQRPIAHKKVKRVQRVVPPASAHGKRKPAKKPKPSQVSHPGTRPVTKPPRHRKRGFCARHPAAKICVLKRDIKRVADRIVKKPHSVVRTPVIKKPVVRKPVVRKTAPKGGVGRDRAPKG